jgi:hypothetical protein
LIQNTIWWIEYAQLDGLRVDTYSYNEKEAISKWTKAITDEYPRLNLMGEVWMHNQAQISYWQKDSPIGALESYNSGLPSVMDFTLHDAITQAFADLEARGLAEDGVVSTAGLAVRELIEERTNELTQRAWQSFGFENTERFLNMVEPIGERLMQRIDETAGPNWMPAARERRP